MTRLALVLLVLASGCASHSGDDPDQGSGGNGGVGGGSAGIGGGGSGGEGGSHGGGPDMALPPGPPPDETQWVDPFIGTARAPGVANPIGGGEGGSDFPGATLPFGMIQFSPDTPGASPSGYGYESTSITGFSLTHFSGAGCPNEGDLPILALPKPSASAFNYQKAHEHATPGYYDVTSDDNVRVELTATMRTGLMRLTFPAGGQPTVIVDATRSQTMSGIAAQMTATAAKDGLDGSTTGGNFCGGGKFPVYFSVRFDHPWSSGGVTAGKANLVFDGATTTVTARIGLSFVSQANAAANLAAESLKSAFDDVRAAAKDNWNRHLNAVQVDGPLDDDKKLFYTALYHTLMHPNVYSDVNGAYMGFDNVQHTVPSGHVQYANFSGWDIYRSQVQLMALLYPDQWSDVVQSLINDAQQCGAFPKWSQNNVEDDVMVGDPGALIVANSYAFGAQAFDTQAALDVMRKMTLDGGAACNGAVELPGTPYYAGVGYVPVGWRVSDVLEYGVRDAAVARFATAVGDHDLQRIANGRSTYWHNALKLSAAPSPLMQPRNLDGSWGAAVAPADGYTDSFTEASSEQYTWYVPHDLRGLFDALGGNAKVVSRLDAFFTNVNAGQSSANCYIGNEPDFSAPFLYDWAGAPWRTQDVVHRSLREVFTTQPGGMAGNDDLGAMSSLIVWFMMGVYPELPGVGGLALASPSFSKVAFHLGNGKTFTITADGLPNHYVQSATLDGAATTALWLPIDKIRAGATLAMKLGAAPSQWGGGAGDVPPSFGPGSFGAVADAFNTRSISANGAPGDGNFDGGGYSYSREALSAAGLPGGNFSFGGVTFATAAAGATLDNLVVDGQTFTFSTTQKGGSIAWLGAASNGPSIGTGVIHYTDGSSAPFTLTMGDWTLNGGGTGAAPPSGNQIAVTTTQRNHAGGAPQTINAYLFFARTTLDGGRTVASVTLPGQVNRGLMHLFSYTLTP